MRIISGNLKGRKLASVKGKQTRPTADRVREALFNILGSFSRDTMVLDLFAGTGALGIEALSRGARKAVFVDRDRQTLLTLRKNIQHCDLQNLTEVYCWDIFRNLDCLKPFTQKFDLVFLDPPYHKNLVPRTLNHLLQLRILSAQAVVVAEHEAHKDIPAPAGLVCKDQRTYGRTRLSFFHLA